MYQWVLERVTDGADESADALNQRRLDDALATTQEAVLDDLEVLITAIDDAVRLPPPDEYAEGASTGGGGGADGASPNQPSVPSAAQLLVLKTMQLDLNARTVRIAEDFDPHQASEQQLRELKKLAERQDRIRELTNRLTEQARASQPAPGHSRNDRSADSSALAGRMQRKTRRSDLGTPVAPLTSEEEEDLSERLLRRATGRGDGDFMDGIMRLMADAREQLDREFDPGKQTQALQQEIVKRLDEAISAAQQQTRRSSGKSTSRSDKRRGKQQAQPKQQPKQADGQTEQVKTGTGQAAGTKGDAQRAERSRRLREFRRGWGHLPARDREEVLQGIDEDVLEPYRELVERYFRTLAEEPEQ